MLTRILLNACSPKYNLNKYWRSLIWHYRFRLPIMQTKFPTKFSSYMVHCFLINITLRLVQYAHLVLGIGLMIYTIA